MVLALRWHVPLPSRTYLYVREGAFGISQRCFRYAPALSGEKEEIEDWLIALTKARKNWGFGLCYLYLRNTQGFKWNHKRVRPLADRRLQSNLPRSGFTVNWS